MSNTGQQERENSFVRFVKITLSLYGHHRKVVGLENTYSLVYFIRSYSWIDCFRECRYSLSSSKCSVTGCSLLFTPHLLNSLFKRGPWGSFSQYVRTASLTFERFHFAFIQNGELIWFFIPKLLINTVLTFRFFRNASVPFVVSLEDFIVRCMDSISVAVIPDLSFVFPSLLEHNSFLIASCYKIDIAFNTLPTSHIIHAPNCYYLINLLLGAGVAQSV